jgi:hypothetical protein
MGEQDWAGPRSSWDMANPPDDRRGLAAVADQRSLCGSLLQRSRNSHLGNRAGGRWRCHLPASGSRLALAVQQLAVVHAADHPRRREYWIGGSTVGTLVANKLMPGLLDRYLARTGYEAQQTDQPANPDRPVNLWEPVDGHGDRDFGAHGFFDDEAVNRSLQAWVRRTSCPGSRRRFDVELLAAAERPQAVAAVSPGAAAPI